MPYPTIARVHKNVIIHVMLHTRSRVISEGFGLTIEVGVDVIMQSAMTGCNECILLLTKPNINTDQPKLRTKLEGAHKVMKPGNRNASPMSFPEFAFLVDMLLTWGC